MTGVWLGIETTSDVGGVALVRREALLSEVRLPERTRHSELLLPAIEEMFSETSLSPADLLGVAVSSGPGSYTGLRIGIASAEGLAAGWGIGLKGVETLRVLAASTGSDLPVLACVRARKDEVFAAVYGGSAHGSPELLIPGAYRASSLEGISEKFPGLVAVGSGRSELGGIQLDWAPRELDTPDPQIVAVLGSQLSLKGFDDVILPVYLRGFMEEAVDALP